MYCSVRQWTHARLGLIAARTVDVPRISVTVSPQSLVYQMKFAAPMVYAGQTGRSAQVIMDARALEHPFGVAMARALHLQRNVGYAQVTHVMPLQSEHLRWP
jgi:hypothetical protein